MGRLRSISVEPATWWWVFGLFIAAPAVALAFLGFRAVRADEIESEARLRNGQDQVARLIGAALADALAHPPASAIRVVVDERGIVAFPTARVYFAPVGVEPRDLKDAAVGERTASGLPAAVVAGLRVDTAAPAERPRFRAELERTLLWLRSGRWWLSIEQRRAYDVELQRWLVAAGGSSGADVELERLASLEQLLRSALGPGARPTQRAELLGTEPVLAIWEAVDEARTHSGSLLTGPDVPAYFDQTMGPVLRGQPFAAALLDHRRRTLWGELTDTSLRTLPMEAVAGWQLAFSRPERTAPATSRRLINSGLVLVPILVLASGLVMTARVIRREMALARLKAEFVAAVTHEFKSPITSIRLLMERLTSGRLEAPEATARYYGAIGAETDRLEDLVNRLLESQKLQTGQKVFTLQPASVSELAESAIGRLRSLADAKSITVDLQAEGDNPDLLLDRESVSDAIGNLLDNAIKYSPPMTRIAVIVRATPAEVRVDVEDEGIGVAAVDRRRIFEPFYRSRRGNQTSVQGTGLGLALVKAAADAHGGTVEVVSNGTRGSCFTLRFPRREAR